MRIWVFWVYSFAIQPFKIVLMIPSSCYQIKSPFYKTQYIFSFFVPLTSLQQWHYFGEAYWTQLPWQKSSYLGLPVITKLCKDSKLKKGFSPPPPTPPFNFGYLFITNMSQKIVCYYKRRVWNTAESTNIKIFHPCDQRCCSQLLSPRLVLLLIQRTLKNFDNSFREHLSKMSYFMNQITLQLEATHKNLNNILSSRKFGRQLHLYSWISSSPFEISLWCLWGC